VTKPNSAVGI